ncbi:MAG: Na+/H+ antiporter NhaA [Acidobacteria bacterium]|nr:Na+/H+ antiporter NhaA [Acidobacteriota bacterium]
MTRRLWTFVIDNSLLLIAGTVIGLTWANIAPDSYQRAAHALHFAVNDVGMVFFFALATKEIIEATLPGGALSSPREAGVPVLAAVGGMAVPAINSSELSMTKVHNLLVMSQSAARSGLVLLALFYPSAPLAPVRFFALMIPALGLAWWLKRRNTRSSWPYVLGAGGCSWMALHLGGLHPALALVPIMPFMPHERRDLGIFDPREERLPDTMNRFDRWWKTPVQFILFFFGLANAGVPLSSVGTATWTVLSALVIGKPIGITLFTWLGIKFGMRAPGGLSVAHTVVVGLAAGIGFTVALFFATAAFPPGAVLAEAKMGALLSFVAFPIAVAVGRGMGLRPGPRTRK